MSRTAELSAAPSAEEDNYSEFHYGVAYSALPDNPYPESAPLAAKKDALNDPTQFIEEITDSHDFKEIVAKFHENDDLLKSDPHLRLVIWEQVVDQLPPLDPEDLEQSKEIILESLHGVRNDPNSANMITLLAVAQTAHYLDTQNQQVVLQTLDGIMQNAHDADSKIGVKIEPNLAHAAEEVIEAAKDGRIDTEDIDAELLRKADLHTAKALDKVIKRKLRKKLFKKIITGKVFRRDTAPTVSEAELDAVADRQMEDMIARERKLYTPTGDFPIQETPEGWEPAAVNTQTRPQPVRRMSLEELEAADDTDENDVASVDSYIEAQMEITKQESHDNSKAA